MPSKQSLPQKPRLGRGLSSLISISKLPVEAEIPADSRPPATSSAAAKLESETSTEQVHSHGPIEIPIDQISPNPHQPRRQFNDAALSELAASLKSNGLIQPIIVRKTDGRFQLIAGERRLRAAKLAGLSTIPALVRDIDSFSQAQMALVENIHREDLNVMDRATAYRALMDQLGLTQAELAQRLGEDRSSIANYLRLLDLAESVRQLVRQDKLSLGHAKILAGISDILEQERLANTVVTQELSVRNLERMVQNPASPPPTQAPGKPSAHLHELEKSFSRQLGMRVQIRTVAKKGKGRLIIHYASLDQFDQLQSRLGIQSDEV